VAWLPLNAEQRSKFNEERAIEWFKSVEGLPYGYHNFLFSWIDTAKHSYPEILDTNLVMVVFSILEKIQPKLVNSFLNEALNKRLGTEDL